MGSVACEPLWNQLLLVLEPEPRLSAILETPKELVDLTRFATVKAVGPEVRDVKVGMRVLASVTAGVELPQGILITEGAVLGILHQ